VRIRDNRASRGVWSESWIGEGGMRVSKEETHAPEAIDPHVCRESKNAPDVLSLPRSALLGCSLDLLWNRFRGVVGGGGE
jgi:hypothetical protein